MKKSVLVLCVLLLPIPVHGIVYTWTDSAGVAHFTNKDYEIPSRYRAKAKSLYPEPGDTGVLQQNLQTNPSSTVMPSSAPVQQSIPETPPLSPVQAKPAESPKAVQTVLEREQQKSLPVRSTSNVKNRRRGPVE